MIPNILEGNVLRYSRGGGGGGAMVLNCFEIDKHSSSSKIFILLSYFSKIRTGEQMGA